jgi:hypothetical protein
VSSKYLRSSFECMRYAIRNSISLCFNWFLFVEFLVRLNANKRLVMHRVRPKRTAAFMFQLGGIVQQQLESIQIAPGHYLKSRRLVNIVLKANNRAMFECFLRALKESKQDDLHLFLTDISEFYFISWLTFQLPIMNHPGLERNTIYRLHYSCQRGASGDDKYASSSFSSLLNPILTPCVAHNPSISETHIV